jgi:hypothetical protein
MTKSTEIDGQELVFSLPGAGRSGEVGWLILWSIFKPYVK